MKETTEIEKLKLKLERYCAYQERCHQDVILKMREFSTDDHTKDELMVHLIQHQFLNEERFACQFARGKHRIKNWGRVRIINELKRRNISQKIIQTALSEIPEEEYLTLFEQLAHRVWENTNEKNVLKKKKKCTDYLLRKGFESDLVYDMIQRLGKSDF